ncbi:hypothetical protein CCP4SC76_2280009 [Gammaproteobacteria bacterium]
MPKKSRVIIGKAVTKAIPTPAGGVRLETFIPWRLVQRNVKREIITPLDAPGEFRVEAGNERRERKAAEETPLVRALGLAYFWRGLMESGRFKTMAEMAEAEGIHVSRVRDFMRLTLLAPDLVERMLGEKTLPRWWSLEFLMRRSIPKDWGEQRGMMTKGMRPFYFLTDAYGRRDTVEDVSREGWLEPEWIDAARGAEGLGGAEGDDGGGVNGFSFLHPYHKPKRAASAFPRAKKCELGECEQREISHLLSLCVCFPLEAF